MKKLFYILVFFFLVTNISAQCNLRFINLTDSVLNINLKRLDVKVNLLPHSASEYMIVPDLLKTEGCVVNVGEIKNNDKFEKQEGKDKTPFTKGTWELSFRWSDNKQTWIIILNEKG